MRLHTGSDSKSLVGYLSPALLLAEQYPFGIDDAHE